MLANTLADQEWASTTKTHVGQLGLLLSASNRGLRQRVAEALSLLLELLLDSLHTRVSVDCLGRGQLVLLVLMTPPLRRQRLYVLLFRL